MSTPTRLRIVAQPDKVSTWGNAGTGHTGEGLCCHKGSDQEPLQQLRAFDDKAVGGTQFFYPQTRDDIGQLAEPRQRLPDGLGGFVMIVPDHKHVGRHRRRARRIDLWNEAFVSRFGAQNDDAVLMAGDCCDCRIIEIIGGQLDGFDGRYCRSRNSGDAFLRPLNPCGQSWLVSAAGGQAARQARNFRARLHKPERDPREYTHFIPSLSTVVKRLVRIVFLRCITPAAPITADED